MQITLRPNEILQVQLGAATTTSGVHCSAQWKQSSVDRNAHVIPTTTTAASLVTAPGQNPLSVTTLVIFNNDTVQATVTISRITDAGVTVTYFQQKLASNSTFIMDETGVRVIDGFGNVLQNVGH